MRGESRNATMDWRSNDPARDGSCPFRQFIRPFPFHSLSRAPGREYTNTPSTREHHRASAAAPSTSAFATASCSGARLGK